MKGKGQSESGQDAIATVPARGDPGDSDGGSASSNAVVLGCGGGGASDSDESPDAEFLRPLSRVPDSGRPGAAGLPGSDGRPSASSDASHSGAMDSDSGQSSAPVVAETWDTFRQPVNPCIRAEEHLRPGQSRYYRRYTTVCPLARDSHCGVFPCGKRRNCGQSQMGDLGPAAPEAFLMVWREGASSFATKREHMAWQPTRREVRRWMVAHGWLPAPSSP